MRLFRTTYRDREARVRQASKWYVEFRDHRDVTRRLPGFASRKATEELARNLERLIAFRSATGGQLDPALRKWLTDLPRSTATRLVEIGLVDAGDVAVSVALTEHRRDFVEALRVKGVTAKHVCLISTRLDRILDGCGFRYWSDISGSRVMRFLSDLRSDRKTDDGETVKGISPQTFNFYLQAVKQFCSWAARERRIDQSPVAVLRPLNVKIDRRHDRRALEPKELRTLIDTTNSGPKRFGMTGAERALLYRFASETGLRAGEIRSLRKRSFDLQGNPPTVTVEAAYSKRRRADTLPLRIDTAEMLRNEISSRTDDAPAFRLPSEHNMADMLRADLVDGGIECKDDAGRVVDFHALRHTFITNLARGGVHPKLAQDLARHSDINLTLSRYSHTVIGEQATALKALPDLSRAESTSRRKTGTDDSSISTLPTPARTPDLVLAFCLALFGGRGQNSVDSGGLKDAIGVPIATPLELGRSVENTCVCKAVFTHSARSSAGQSNGFLNRRS